MPFGYTLQRTDGKTNWRLIRRVFYTLLIVWAFCVRLAGIDPLNLASLITVAWLLDAIFFVAFCILVWHVIESREKSTS